MITVYKASLGHYWTLLMGVITWSCMIERMAEKNYLLELFRQGRRDIYSESVSPYQETDCNSSAFSVFDIKNVCKMYNRNFLKSMGWLHQKQNVNLIE